MCTNKANAFDVNFSGVYSKGQEITITLMTNYVGFLSTVSLHMIPQTAGIRECISTLDAPNLN